MNKPYFDREELRTTRSKGGYEVWCDNGPPPTSVVWMTRMGADREREKLIKMNRSLDGHLQLVYVHVLTDD